MIENKYPTNYNNAIVPSEAEFLQMVFNNNDSMLTESELRLLWHAFSKK